MFYINLRSLLLCRCTHHIYEWANISFPCAFIDWLSAATLHTVHVWHWTLWVSGPSISLYSIQCTANCRCTNWSNATQQVFLVVTAILSWNEFSPFDICPRLEWCMSKQRHMLVALYMHWSICYFDGRLPGWRCHCLIDQSIQHTHRPSLWDE